MGRRRGKLYITDYANEWLYVTFPNYQTFHEVDGNPDLDAFETFGHILDEDLLAWLSAMPEPLKDINSINSIPLPTLSLLPMVTIQGIWSGLKSVEEIWVTNDQGVEVNVGHYTWVEGAGNNVSGVPNDMNYPMTVTGRHGCGKMMFSTYHTSDEAHLGLTPQELIMLYMIMEIGVCEGDSVPPVPIG